MTALAAAQRAVGHAHSWALMLHTRSWAEWAALATLALSTGQRLQVHLDNNSGVTVTAPPDGSYWTFWPPSQHPAVPLEYEPLAWTLAEACGTRGSW